jgi:hypothetical protein
MFSSMSPSELPQLGYIPGKGLTRIMHDGVRFGTPDVGRMPSARLAWAV